MLVFLKAFLFAIPSFILSAIYSEIYRKHPFTINKNLVILFVIVLIICYGISIASLFLFIFIDDKQYLNYIVGTIICSVAEFIITSHEDLMEM